jgi:hypothetical protein
VPRALQPRASVLNAVEKAAPPRRSSGTSGGWIDASVRSSHAAAGDHRLVADLKLMKPERGSIGRLRILENARWRSFVGAPPR